MENTNLKTRRQKNGALAHLLGWTQFEAPPVGGYIRRWVDPTGKTHLYLPDLMSVLDDDE